MLAANFSYVMINNIYRSFVSQQRLGATQAEIQERIHDRLKQMEELKHAVDALKVCNHTINLTDKTRPTLTRV